MLPFSLLKEDFSLSHISERTPKLSPLFVIREMSSNLMRNVRKRICNLASNLSDNIAKLMKIIALFSMNNKVSYLKVPF